MAEDTKRTEAQQKEFENLKTVADLLPDAANSTNDDVISRHHDLFCFSSSSFSLPFSSPFFCASLLFLLSLPSFSDLFLFSDIARLEALRAATMQRLAALAKQWEDVKAALLQKYNQLKDQLDQKVRKK